MIQFKISQRARVHCADAGAWLKQSVAANAHFDNGLGRPQPHEGSERQLEAAVPTSMGAA